MESLIFADYSDMRCTLGRERDLQLFRGWVEKVDAHTLIVRAVGKVDLLPDDFVRVEVNGFENDLVFTARFKQTQHVSSNQGFFYSVWSDESDTLALVDSGRTQLEFEVESEISASAPRENARRSVCGLTGHICYLDEWHAVQLLDVSKGGVGFVSPVPLPKNEIVELRISDGHNCLISLFSEVRHCSPEREKRFSWRSGVQLDPEQAAEDPIWFDLLQRVRKSA